MRESLLQDPYRIFVGSMTPPGLYARKNWLGEEESSRWKQDCDVTVHRITDSQLPNGSWNDSFLDTLRGLLGLHLTVRTRTRPATRGITWLVRNYLRYGLDGAVEPHPNVLAGLPFVQSTPSIFALSATLFTMSVFELGETAAARDLYDVLSEKVTDIMKTRSRPGDISNILRAFAVNRTQSKSETVTEIVTKLASTQHISGEWPLMPFYQTVNALAHLSSHPVDVQLDKAFHLIRRTQNPDGSWGNEDREWNTFLVVHTLRNKNMLSDNNTRYPVYNMGTER